MPLLLRLAVLWKQKLWLKSVCVCVRAQNIHATGQWCQMAWVNCHLIWGLLYDAKRKSDRDRENKAHYLFMFYKIVNVCLMVLVDIENMESLVVTNSVFHHFMPLCSFYHHIICCSNWLLLLLSLPLSPIFSQTCVFFIAKMARMESLIRPFGDVDHFANQLFAKKVPYKTPFFFFP